MLKKGRRSNGTSLAELGAILVLVVMVVLFCVDAAVVLIASSINDRACRDAARAAAQASNSNSAELQAKAMLKNYPSTNPYIGVPTFSQADFVYQDFAGNPPPDTSPFVSVTTTMTAKIPAPIIWNVSLGQSGSVNFSQTYSFPIVKTTLYLN